MKKGDTGYPGRRRYLLEAGASKFPLPLSWGRRYLLAFWHDTKVSPVWQTSQNLW